MFSNVKTKTNSSFVKVTERSNHFCTEFLWRIFVLNSVKHKFFHVSIVKKCLITDINKIFYIRLKYGLLIQGSFDLTVCFYYVTYAFQGESTFYSCLNAKELLARSRREIWSLSICNWTRTHNHFVHKRTLNHLTKVFKCLLMN